MSPNPTDLLHKLFGPNDSLSARLAVLHDRMLLGIPSIARVACALYDPQDDLLKTFINSTRDGQAIADYQYRLSDSASLSALAKSGETRVLVDIPEQIPPGTPHSDWVRKQGYRSSFTVPLYDNGALLAIVFFDAMEPHAFTPAVQRDLVLYCGLINMMLANEMAAVRAIIGSAKAARDFTDLRDFETGAHLERMARYSRLIAKAVAPRHGLGDEYIEHLFLFAPLHDVGKIGIPDAVLLKPGRLTPEERAIMETHVEKGEQVVAKLLGDFGLEHMADSEVLRNVVGGHHEMLDGSGYPRGLQGEAIALEARIVAVADIFDALTSARPYKPAWTIDAAFAELDAMAAAGKLDAECVAALRAVTEEIMEIRATYTDHREHA